MNNLISLCNTCHDLVEINGFDFEFIKGDIKVMAKNNDWHKWVYGGYSRPER
jgi:hypothetical protein